MKRIKKYRIVNRTTNQIICERKGPGPIGDRHYRQNIDNIPDSLIPVETTLERATREMEYLNEEYLGGWTVEEV